MPNNIKFKEKSATLRVLPVKNKLHAKDRAVSRKRPRSRPLLTSEFMVPCGREA